MLYIPLTLVLDVTEECIEHGIQDDCNECPYAIATGNALTAHEEANDETFDVLRYEVQDTHIYVRALSEMYIDQAVFPLESEHQEWIAAFDAGEEVAPIRAMLEQSDTATFSYNGVLTL